MQTTIEAKRHYQDLEKIELDCVYNDKRKIEIHSPLIYSDAASQQGDKQLSFKQDNDKLVIDIGKSKEGSKFSLVINYSTMAIYFLQTTIVQMAWDSTL